MKISEIQVGDKVVHAPKSGKSFGVGVVLSIKAVKSPSRWFHQAKVQFNSNEIKEFDIGFLDKFVDEKQMKTSAFQVGDSVEHKRYGKGTVVGFKGMFVLVNFLSKKDATITLEPSYLKKAEEIITETLPEEEEEFESKLQVIPSNFSEQACYPTSAKRLVNYLRKQCTSTGFISMKSYQENDGTVGVFAVAGQGIIVFKMIDAEISLDTVCSPLFEMLVESQHYKALKEYYLNKFLQSKSLCEIIDGKGKILKYPYRFVVVYQNVSIEKKSDRERLRSVLKNRDIYFKNFTTPFEKNPLFSHFENHSAEFKRIPSEVNGLILERVIPENATLIQILPQEKKTISIGNDPKFHPITGEEREFNALSLDDFQIKAINDTKPGHYLTLANPGTGKSVLLISKAYRIQSMVNDNHVLVTCYNKNLAEHHSTFAQISGLKTKNLHILTFHRLALMLLNKVDVTFTQQHNIAEDSDNFNLAIDRLEELINLGKVKTKFNAIFIDEIQLLEPKWIDICFALLDKEDDKTYYFEMFGDINQDVNSKRSKGKASWQQAKTLPSLAGRVKKLERNYRNTDLIANYLKCMIEEFNEFLNKHGIPIDPESACMSSVTSRKGIIKPKVLMAPANNATKIIQVITELVEKQNVEYNDIAIVYPAKGYGKWYRPQWNIEKALQDAFIPYSMIHGDKRQKLFECDGVIMSTVDSCLGLDFKYVILCGLHYWDFIYEESTNTTEKLDARKLLFDQEVQYFYSEAGKKIYSACSRARDGLFIIDDTDVNSPIKKIVRPISGRSYFDEHK